jgi:ribosome-associated protein
MEKFTLKDSEEYIELNNLIKLLGWVATGGEAKIRIQEGEIKVNDQVEIRVRKKVRSGETVTFASEKCIVE